MKSLLAVLLLASATAAYADPPAAWDWRDVEGVDYTTPVENTGSCGATWIFAPVSMVEARLRIAAARQGIPLPDADFSEQHVMDCGTGYFGQFDCDGGYSKDVVDHIRDNGVVMEHCYEWMGTEGTCPTDCPDSAAELALHFPVLETGELSGFPAELDLMQEIHDHGPVATTLDLYQDIYSHASGVYQHVDGGLVGSAVVLVVGWGDDGTPYWICRNAWGEGWAESGDFLVARNAQHANCDFGEWVWTCTTDAAAPINATMSLGEIKRLYR